MTYRIGWEVLDFAASIKAGSSGVQRATMVVTADDGSALPDYSGWSSNVVFRSPFDGRTVITMSPPVTGDLIAMTLAIDLDFLPATTIDLKPGLYTGDICMISPAGEHYYPLSQYQLTIEGSVN